MSRATAAQQDDADAHLLQKKERRNRRGTRFFRGARIVGRLPRFVFRRWPLVVGLVFLSISVAVFESTPIRLSFASDPGFGGTDVAVIEVDHVPSPQEEVFVRSVAPFQFQSEDGSQEGQQRVLGGEFALRADALVSVPRNPELPEEARDRSARTYTVASGDNLSAIAKRYGVSLRALAYSNNIVDPDSIRPGDEIRIPPVDGVLHTVKKGETLAKIAKRYQVEQSEILSYNGLPADGSLLNVGDELVIPGGKPPAPPRRRVFARRRSSVPTFAKGAVPLGYYIAPTTGYNFGRIHPTNAVDIANACGTPIYAAAAGEVILAKYGTFSRYSNGGYGTYLKIRHENGTVTLYAHNSELMVRAGDRVAQGQLIALMGTTGRSTGCHVHFEVRGARNPLGRY